MICNTSLNSYRKWWVGNNIRDILLADSGVTAQVGTNIYPIVAAENTDGDFIVYSRQEYSKSSVKQGVYEDNCVVAVVAISDSYDRAVGLAEKIDLALTGTHNINEDVSIDIILQDSTETYEDNKYIETLLFRIK